MTMVQREQTPDHTNGNRNHEAETKQRGRGAEHLRLLDLALRVSSTLSRAAMDHGAYASVCECPRSLSPCSAFEPQFHGRWEEFVPTAVFNHLSHMSVAPMSQKISLVLRDGHFFIISNLLLNDEGHWNDKKLSLVSEILDLDMLQLRRIRRGSTFSSSSSELSWPAITRLGSPVAFHGLAVGVLYGVQSR